MHRNFKTNHKIIKMNKRPVISVLFFLILLVLLGYGLAEIICTGQLSENEPMKIQSLWMDYQRTYPNKGIKPEPVIKAMRDAREIHQNSSRGAYEWEEAGPTNIGGRITDLEFDPIDINTIYVGASTGGIFKSINGGSDWVQVFGQAATISIGDLAVDPNNPQVVYAGTGESNSSSYSFLGDGIYKSVNGGQSWSNIGLETSAYIGRVIVDYSNSDNIFVAACGNLFSWGGERGIYKSTNGGTTWENILYVNDSTSGIDLVQHPGNPEILYAAMWERRRGLNYRNSFGDGSGIYKTTNGGNTWTELTNNLPTGSNVGRIGLALAESNPNVIYAFYDMPNQEVRVYRTNDGGLSWNRTNDGNLSGMNSSFGWYFGQVRVDPVDENVAYTLGVEMYRTTNGGNSWQVIADYSSNDIHVDHHAMFINKNSGRIYEGNDGGFYFSDDQGDSWEKINNLPITQFYFIEVNYLFPHRLLGGTQDNNTGMTWNGGLNDWFPILGGDGFYCLVDYVNSNNVYAEYQNVGLCKSTDGGFEFSYIADAMSGDRINWMAPLAMDPVDPDILYFGTHRVWKSFNGGWNWSASSGDLTQGGSGSFHTITTIDISPLDPQIVVTGSADGKVFVSANAGLSWTDISNDLPLRWITRVACDPFDENKIYATVSGFRWDEPQPHVFVTDNLGQNWTNISSNLPELPVNVIVCDPESEGRLFIGTDAGMFYTENHGSTWESFNFNMPSVAVVALDLHNPTRKLIAGTYGLSAFTFDLDQLVSVEENKPDEQVNSITVAPNPFSSASGQLLTISFNNQQQQIVNVRILNINGDIIREYRSIEQAELTWDGTDRNGNKVPPGNYIVRLKTIKNSFSAKLVIGI